MLRTPLLMIFGLLIFACALGTMGAHAQDNDEVTALNGRVAELIRQGRYAEATPLAERALALAENAPDGPHLAAPVSANNLGVLYQMQGRYTEAEPLLRRALEKTEQILGPRHSGTLGLLNNLAELYRAQARYGEAETLFRRVLEGQEQSLAAEHPATLTTVNNLAALYDDMGRYPEAETLHRRALEVRERVQGPEHPDTLKGVNNLASVYLHQGRYDKAEPLFRRVFETSERRLGSEHPDALTAMNNLAGVYNGEGRLDEAEALYRRVLQVRERVQGTEHPSTLKSVNNLASAYQDQRRYREAEPLFRRALESSERVLGREHPDTLTSVNNLAQLYRIEERYDEAEALFRRASDTAERTLGHEHPQTLVILSNLALLYDTQRRYGDAEALYRRLTDARARVLGRDHPATLRSRANLATLYRRQGRYDEAEPLYRHTLEALERVLGREHPDTLNIIGSLGSLAFARQDWLQAAQWWRRSTAAVIGRTRRGVLDDTQMRAQAGETEVEQQGWQFAALVKTMDRITAGAVQDQETLAESFEAAQWARGSETAQSMAQMAARGAAGNATLAALVRERQDKLAEWQGLEAWRNAAIGKPATMRNAAIEAENTARLDAIDKRIGEIDSRLAADFPDYFALADPGSLSFTSARALLKADEALVMFLDTRAYSSAPEETFVWVVTRTDMRRVRTDIGKAALADEVHALRCGLDAASWYEPSPCPALTGQSRPEETLRFDHARAYKLYKALFGQVEDLIAGKELLVVPSGALTQLPFSVLVTSPPSGGNDRAARWLVRDHAVSVLPAVSSLKALRATAHASSATRPMVGFGNPVLDGTDASSKAAELARNTSHCRSGAWKRLKELVAWRGVGPVSLHNRRADVSELRRLQPLPETADELCAVASDLGAEGTDIHLGIRASEREVKAMSGRGELAQYRIVHFATHGAMAGDLRSSEEPGLVLTPPQLASEEDDGYLSASEIAALKLDADWVILSACNTAAARAVDAEALSGLARAFIYAQARALLVSHWAVYSDATVKLITTAIHEMARDKTVGRAEALRRAMLALIDRGDMSEAHPAYWAPFIVVGEGGS